MPPGEALQAGSAAPEFDLKATPDQSVRLGDFHGRRLIMAFYPADWSPVCTDVNGIRHNGGYDLETLLETLRAEL